MSTALKRAALANTSMMWSVSSSASGSHLGPLDRRRDAVVHVGLDLGPGHAHESPVAHPGRDGLRHLAPPCRRRRLTPSQRPHRTAACHTSLVPGPGDVTGRYFGKVDGRSRREGDGTRIRATSRGPIRGSRGSGGWNVPRDEGWPEAGEAPRLGCGLRRPLGRGSPGAGANQEEDRRYQHLALAAGFSEMGSVAGGTIWGH